MAEFKTLKLGDSVAQGQNLAMNNFRLGEAKRTVDARQGLTGALQQGTPEAMNEYSQQFPQESMQYQQDATKTKKDAIEEKLFEFSVAEKLMAGVQDEQTFQRARQMATEAGMDTGKWPANFDPVFLKQSMNQALGVKSQLEMQLREMEKASDRSMKERQLSETERHNRTTEELTRTKVNQEKPPKINDTERTAGGYALRMEEAEKTMSGVKSGQKPGVIESMAATLPGVGKLASNSARSDDRQIYRQAQEDWVRSKLRKESGAVIADEEMDREIRVYFPQLGDSDAVINQKAKARQTAMQAMKQASGKGYMGEVETDSQKPPKSVGDYFK
jgi:hypothetical protein